MRVFTSLDRRWVGKIVRVEYRPVVWMSEVVGTRPALVGVVQRAASAGVDGDPRPQDEETAAHVDEVRAFVADMITDIQGIKEQIEDEHGEPLQWSDLDTAQRASVLVQLGALGEDIGALTLHVLSQHTPDPADLEG